MHIRSDPLSYCAVQHLPLDARWVCVFLTKGPVKPMMKRSEPQKGFSVKQFLQRVDRVAGDLNVLLVVVAIGLATLDFTFLVTQKVIDHLPPATRMVHDAEPPASN